MSELQNLKREQEKTNFWLAFIAGSMVSVPGWLSGSITVAFWLFLIGCFLAVLWAWVWVEVMQRSWSLLIGCIACAAMFVGVFFLPAKSHAAGAMFWGSDGSYQGQVLQSGPNAVQVYGGDGSYQGQVLKSGPNSVQFYGGDGSYLGQAIGNGPSVPDMSGIKINPNSGDLSNLTGVNPSSSDLSNITGIQ